MQTSGLQISTHQNPRNCPCRPHPDLPPKVNAISSWKLPGSPSPLKFGDSIWRYYCIIRTSSRWGHLEPPGPHPTKQSLITASGEMRLPDGSNSDWFNPPGVHSTNLYTMSTMPRGMCAWFRTSKHPSLTRQLKASLCQAYQNDSKTSTALAAPFSSV
jgi:hypothetical protein